MYKDNFYYRIFFFRIRTFLLHIEFVKGHEAVRGHEHEMKIRMRRICLPS